MPVLIIAIIIIVIVVIVKIVKSQETTAVEKLINLEIDARRTRYQMSSKAKIDSNEFFDSSRSHKSYLFAKYLSDVCEENIPVITEMFAQVNPDQKATADEVAAFLYFSAMTLMKTTGLEYRELHTQVLTQSEQHGRDDTTYWNRELIYEDIIYGKPVRAYWDPSGKLVSKNSNSLISCLMAMCDFIWEPHLKDATEYNEYFSKPLALKSIDKAMQFQTVYSDVSMQVALFMEMVSGTAHKLKLL